MTRERLISVFLDKLPTADRTWSADLWSAWFDAFFRIADLVLEHEAAGANEFSDAAAGWRPTIATEAP